MGLFSDLKAMNDLQQIKHGGVGKLSLSQITCFIVNMPDAKKNLSAKEYDAIYISIGAQTDKNFDIEGAGVRIGCLCNRCKQEAYYV